MVAISLHQPLTLLNLTQQQNLTTNYQPPFNHTFLYLVTHCRSGSSLLLGSLSALVPHPPTTATTSAFLLGLLWTFTSPVGVYLHHISLHGSGSPLPQPKKDVKISPLGTHLRAFPQIAKCHFINILVLRILLLPRQPFLLPITQCLNIYSVIAAI